MTIVQQETTNLDLQLSALSQPRSGELYYAITLIADENDKVEFCTQSEWVGWANEERRIELRQARLVYPKFVELWQIARQPYAIIHTVDEAILFLIGGGNALVEQALARGIFPRLLRSDPSVPRGRAGFVSPSLLQKTAFRRAPTPKLRMEVLKRDGRRCRICGRRPDDNVDLVLHVHHIRPWEKGGITDHSNLITLCHTCHTGLYPHHDPSLFEYLDSPSGDPIEEELKEFRRGVARFRKVGFFSTIDEDGPKRASRPTRKR
jgi:hypothetical protein